jgi:hypothetical protein
MVALDEVVASFPGIHDISDASRRDLVLDVWKAAADRRTLDLPLEHIPISPTLPVDQHGTLAMHIRAMADVGSAVVRAYEEHLDVAMLLDDVLTAVYVHDVAKLYEFSFRADRLVGTPGFNHALEGARLVEHCGAPPSVVEMVRSHSFAGPLIMPATREAQLFMFLDAICLRAFPEDGDDAVRRHLRSNGWEVPNRRPT